MTFINRGDLDGAIGPGVALVDKFGSANCDAKLVATLANLLLNRNESGDAERAVAMTTVGRSSRAPRSAVHCPMPTPPSPPTSWN